MAEFVVYGHHSYHQSSGFLRTPRDYSSWQTACLKINRNTIQSKLKGSTPWRCTWSSTPKGAIMSRMESRTLAIELKVLPPRDSLLLQSWSENWLKSGHWARDCDFFLRLLLSVFQSSTLNSFSWYKLVQLLVPLTVAHLFYL